MAKPNKQIRTSSSTRTISTNLLDFIKSSPNNYKPSHTNIHIIPRNTSQQKSLDSLLKNKITLGIGPAGTGKTYLATLKALDDLIEGRVDKIIIVRPSVQVEGENDLGALPGDILGKFGPQVKAMTDTMIEYLGSTKFNQLILAEIIEIVPVAFIRGRSFKRCWILVDEAQNLSIDGMKSVLTRISYESKMVVMGDIDQSDRSENQGLKDILSRFKYRKVPDMNLIEFRNEDVEREPIVKYILKLYN